MAEHLFRNRNWKFRKSTGTRITELKVKSEAGDECPASWQVGVKIYRIESVIAVEQVHDPNFDFGHSTRESVTRNKVMLPKIRV